MIIIIIIIMTANNGLEGHIRLVVASWLTQTWDSCAVQSISRPSGDAACANYQQLALADAHARANTHAECEHARRVCSTSGAAGACSGVCWGLVSTVNVYTSRG